MTDTIFELDVDPNREMMLKRFVSLLARMVTKDDTVTELRVGYPTGVEYEHEHEYEYEHY
jgi:hypothetical protein